MKNSKRLCGILFLALLALGLHAMGAGLDVLPPDPVGEGPPFGRLARTEQPQAHVLLRIREKNAIPHRFAFAPNVGSRLCYTFTSDAQTTMHTHANAAQQQMHLAFDGSLILDVLDRRNDENLIAVRFHPLRVTATGFDGAPAPELARRIEAAMAKETLVRYTVRGRIAGIRFAAGSHPQLNSMVRGILTQAQLVLPPAGDSSARWKSTDPDPQGTAQLTYEWRRPFTYANANSSQGSENDYTAELAKTKLRIRSGKDGGGGPQTKLHGSGLATLDRSLSWFRELEYHERTDLKLRELSARITGTASTRITLEAQSRIALRKNDELWNGPWGKLDARESLARFHADRERQRRVAAVADVSIDKLLQVLLEELRKGKLGTIAIVEARRNISAKVSTDPDALATLRLRLQELDGERLTQQQGLIAIAESSTPAAQKTLGQMAQDAALSGQLRTNAINACFCVKDPGPALLADLAAVTDRGTGIRDLDSGSLLVTGALIARLGRSGQAKANGFLQRLLRGEHLAVNRKLTGSWLEALGNVGTEAVLGPASRYLDHQSPAIRANAVSALRKLDNAQARSMIFDKCEHDRAASVRREAIGILCQSPRADSLNVVERRLANESNTAVRERAIKTLVRYQPKHPRVQRILASVANQDPSARLRKLARSAL